MDFFKTNTDDVIIIFPKIFGDKRGYFLETFREEEFISHDIGPKFVQDNHSGSQKGVLRGLHYQIRQAQGKLIRVVAGEIYDVVLDIRKNSNTFGQWTGVFLSSEYKQQLWVPPGFAHGFLVVSEWAEVTYKATDYYAPQFERTIFWNDPDLQIRWPLIPGVDPIISAKDEKGTAFKDAEYFL